MNYLDELKKYKNNFVQTAQNVGNAVQSGVKELYNTGQQAVQNVQNAVKGNAQPEYDMAAQYDNYKAEQQAQRAAAQQAQQQTGQQTQSQWQSQLDNIMNQIMNREKFSYDMNGDALYQQYADIYQNQANLGMQNAMAQNAALTGGYGSSYSQMAGQQAYAQQMQGLNEVGMDLYDRALNQYLAEGDQLNDRYAMLAAREEQEYNRGLDERNYQYQLDRDAVSDAQWRESMDYQANRDAVSDAQWQQSMDYQKDRDAVSDAQWNESLQYQKDRDAVSDAQWQAELDRYIANDATANKQWQKEYDRAVANDATANKQWEDSFAYQKEQDKLTQQNYENEMAYQKERDEVGDKQWQATMDYQTERDKVYDSQWQAELDRYIANDKQAQENWQAEMDYKAGRDKIEDKQWEKSFNASYGDGTKTGSSTVYEGGGALDGQEVPNILANVEGLTTDDTSFFDSNGKFMVAEYTGTDKDGNMIYRYNGKNVTVDKGTNPYTRTENTDIEYGTFGNGYQPNNVASYYGDAEMGKLTETGITDRVNGIVQNVYKDATGKTWIWDDTKNEYMEYGFYAETGGDGPVNQKPLLDKFNTRN